MSVSTLRYFDSNATTPVATQVVDALLPMLEQHWGNPSSAYRFGHEVTGAINHARRQVATLLGAKPEEIVFTGCGTESNNTAIHSALRAQPEKKHVITSAVEHPSVLRHARSLETLGYPVTYLPVDQDGCLDLGRLEQAFRPDTAIVSLMWANNETGIIFPIQEVAALCQARGVPCHTDAIQAVGKVQLDAASIGLDYLSLSGHKFHAPKGIGALYVRSGTPFQPYLLGGGQERGRRAGTENVPYIIGLGRAAELAAERLAEMQTRVRALRDRMEHGILNAIEGTTRNGSPEPRLPNTSNLSFAGVEAEGLLIALDQKGICASSGSACAAGSIEPSHVLVAMGLSLDRARGAIRFSLGRDTTEEEVAYLLDELPGLIARLRAAAPALRFS